MHDRPCCMYFMSQVIAVLVSAASLSVWRLWVLRCSGWAERGMSPSWPEMISACYCRGIQQHLQPIYADNKAYSVCVAVWLHVGLFSSFRKDQLGLAHLMEKELKRVSMRLEQLSRHQHHQPNTPPPPEALIHTGKAQHRTLSLLIVLKL